MIHGTVNDRLEAVVQIAVRGSDDTPVSVDAVIDTGFSDYLTLPENLVQTLDLQRIGPTDAKLADGQLVSLDVYGAIVDWEGVPRDILIVAAGSGPLVGMKLIEGCNLSIRVRPGGGVTIDQAK